MSECKWCKDLILPRWDIYNCDYCHGKLAWFKSEPIIDMTHWMPLPNPPEKVC